MTPRPLQLLYATHDGQAKRIASRLASHWTRMGLAPTVFDLEQQRPDPSLWPEESTIVVVAPIRFGYHLPSVETFLRQNTSFLKTQDLVLISISLTARKPAKNTPETNRYYKKWIRRHGLTPRLGVVLGGRLAYRLYKPWEKWAIRFIMALTGGPTNFNAVVDYTPWEKVDALAAQIATLAKKEKAA